MGSYNREENVERALRFVSKKEHQRYKEKVDAHYIENDARINAKGKLKKKKRTSGPQAQNHKPQARGTFYKARRVENPGASLGWTQEEYDTFVKTGKVPEKD